MAVRVSRTTIGVALVGLGLLMAVWSYNGYGDARTCGYMALTCLYRALAWHLGLQGMATVVLWWEVFSPQKNTRQKWARYALAMGATLVLLFPALVLASVFLL
ncbi:MAG: hypothetical protein V4645_17850 [Pseudomonadota bacterium]